MLITVIMAVLFLAALIRTWLLRRVETKLLKNKDVLEQQVVQQQRDLMAVRQDANAWRTEMKRQFDLFRHMASDQLKVEEKRFDDLLRRSREREHSLQSSLDITKQMCAELPSTKARLMQLESVVGLDAGEGFSTPSPLAAAEPKFLISPLPDLNGSAPEIAEEKLAEPTHNADSIPAISDEANLQLSELQKQNMQLQQALTAARLRSRIRDKQSTPRGRGGKN